MLHLDSLPPRITKGDLLAFLCNATGLRGEQVGKIDLHGNSAVIDIPANTLPRAVKALDGAELKQRRVRAWAASSAADPNDHFHRLARLLELESRAEAERIVAEAGNAERNGDSLTGLAILEESSGLGGRFILTLGKRNRSQELPWNRLEPGTPVLLAGHPKADESWRGVVCERNRSEIHVALGEPLDDEGRPALFRLNLSPDEKARQRQLAGMERARTAERDRLAEMRRILLGESAPAFRDAVEWSPLDAALDASQREAITLALSARDVAILHGPPGTGKTTAVVELIRQAVRRGQKVLACAPSNLAVDNLLERLLQHGEKAVRLGHPARVLPALREHTLDFMVESHDDTRQARKLAKKAFALFRQAGKWTRGKPEPGSKQAMRQEGRALLDDARKLENLAVDRILGAATIVAATLTGLDSEVLGQRRFDLAVIDEAAQCTEPVCWLPILRSDSLVLAGDHCQLPPTILSAEAAEQGFGISMMERLVARYGNTVTRRLETQYRMHEAIMRFSSDHFYDGSLHAHDSVAAHRLCELPGVQTEPMTESAVQFIDTAGAGYDEEEEPGGSSRRNPQEAALVAKKTNALLKAGVPAASIAVIAPYSAQVRLLRDMLPVADLEIDSVDGFQGREKEAVVLSLVRSNLEGEVGFLADVRRMNVALTRARRKLLVVGDSATLSNHPFFADLFAYFESIGAHHSVWEEMD
jgi:ATP-dependent RNA/DNA helicase IGHMBP2